MLIVRYQTADERPRVGALDGGRVRPLAVSTLASMLAAKSEFAAALDTAGGPGADVNDVRLLAPVDGATEVWAAGVTYTRSRDARMEESTHAEDIYDRVYSAERPELFFKSVAWRAVGPGAEVSIRRDSAMTVPEPELAVVVAADGEIIGYTI
ncbi:MAG: Rv2993c-like domain-containing protein, partial [Acidimicrobiia bacterium]